MGIRLVVVDDNPHVAWEGRIHPVNATFQRFAAAVLDLPGSPVASVTSCVPLRDATTPPDTLPLDPRTRVVGTEPFDGIAGYLRHLPGLLGANRPTLRQAIGEADLLWLKVPASNATLAAAIARRAGTPRFVWVAGSAADVAGARFGGMARVGAAAVGLGYDAIGRLGGRRRPSARRRRRISWTATASSRASWKPTSCAIRTHRPWPPGAGDGRVHFAWAGRLAAGKGLESLLAAVAADPALELELLGDGPDRARLVDLAASSGAGDRIRWSGHIADRATYLDHLAAADAFVFPSPSEGFPKVVLDAFAVGLPVARDLGRRARRADRGGPRRADRCPGGGVGHRRLEAPRGDGTDARRRSTPARPGLRRRPHPPSRGRPPRRALANLVAGPAVAALSA